MSNSQQIFPRDGWTLETVQIGQVSVEIPVCEIVGNRPGKTLLVTGGMDGDEYAGMEAVNALREFFADGNFAGRLRLVPIVNIPGFKSGCSQNPIDQLSPQYLYPGNPNGSSTDKLVAWLKRTKIDGSDAWMDLHGGSSRDSIQPFVWTFKSGVKNLDDQILKFQSLADADFIIHDTSLLEGRSRDLAKQNCIFILAESGARTIREEENISRHVNWVKSLMVTLGMIQESSEPNVKAKIYNNVREIKIPVTGTWKIQTIGKEIKKGSLFGTASKEGDSLPIEFLAPITGIPLWWKDCNKVNKGEVVMAIAY